MYLHRYAKHRLKACLHEIETIKQGEFPYGDAQEALQLIESKIRSSLGTISTLDALTDPATASLNCFAALRVLALYLPVLGFVLRSTNIRNAFEVYRPLRRLASDILEPEEINLKERQTRLLLSSEWEYVPFTYTNLPALPAFVLIGLPASETSNPLLIPMAAHELGHSIWKKQLLDSQLNTEIISSVNGIVAERWTEYQAFYDLDSISKEQSLTNLFVSEIKIRPTAWVTCQVEEIFCDSIGVALFGESYLRAFAYLFSPKYSETRSSSYPNSRIRVRYLERSAELFGVSIPSGYHLLFDDSKTPFESDIENLLLRTADDAVELLLPKILDVAKRVIETSNIVLPSPDGANAILGRYKLMVPSEQVRCLADILNAGWMVFDKISSHSDGDSAEPFWTILPHGESEDTDLDDEFNVSILILKDIMLKNFEIFEVEQRLQALA